MLFPEVCAAPQGVTEASNVANVAMYAQLPMPLLEDKDKNAETTFSVGEDG